MQLTCRGHVSWNPASALGYSHVTADCAHDLLLIDSLVEIYSVIIIIFLVAILWCRHNDEDLVLVCGCALCHRADCGGRSEGETV